MILSRKSHQAEPEFIAAVSAKKTEHRDGSMKNFVEATAYMGEHGIKNGWE
jgi:hypothetical protein